MRLLTKINHQRKQLYLRVFLNFWEPQFLLWGGFHEFMRALKQWRSLLLTPTCCLLQQTRKCTNDRNDPSGIFQGHVFVLGRTSKLYRFGPTPTDDAKLQLRPIGSPSLKTLFMGAGRIHSFGIHRQLPKGGTSRG